MDTKFVQRTFLCIILIFATNFANFTEAVVGGDKAMPGEFPYAVKIVDILSGENFCSGSILRYDVVITAAHCLFMSNGRKYPPDWIRVSAGGVLMGKYGKAFGAELEEGEQMSDVSHYVVHPSYNSISLAGNDDIALLFLEEPFKYTEKVAPIQLPSSQTYSNGTFSGWGRVENGRKSQYLKKLIVSLDKKEACNEGVFLYNKVTDFELCTKFETGVSLCEGDSGGPLICKQPYILFSDSLLSRETKLIMSPVICGVSSRTIDWGSHCGETKSIAIFTDISKYLDWIRETMYTKIFPNSVDKVDHPKIKLNCTDLERPAVCGIHGYTCISKEEICGDIKGCEDGTDVLIRADGCRFKNNSVTPPPAAADVIEMEVKVTEKVKTEVDGDVEVKRNSSEGRQTSRGEVSIFWFISIAIVGIGLIFGVILYLKKEIMKPVDDLV